MSEKQRCKATKAKSVELTAYVADKKMNDLMAAADLCPEYKVFITGEHQLRFQTTTKVDQKYIMNLINASREGKDIWIPAIKWKEQLYVADGIKEISDGERVTFV